MATLIHQTGTRTAMTFKHESHDDTILIMPTGNPGLWYIIREHGHEMVNPCAVRTADEIFATYGFEIEAWETPAL